MDKQLVLDGADQTREFAARFALTLPKKCLLALFGDLGAGKTTFMQGLVRGLGGLEEEVHSPTFVYLHHYSAPMPIFHFDLYRLKKSEDFFALGFEEYFEKEGVTAIEWPERIEENLPPSTISLRFVHQGTKRVLHY
jgi:tRNA threonylcarbamoyladenosine biosynthesis protein TsaE